VAAATTLLTRDPENFASVAQVAQEAGLAKGTVYLYFKTKEEMLMAIHVDQSNQLFDNLDSLFTLARPITSLDLIDSFCDFVSNHPLFLQVAAICHSSLERNIDPAVLVDFRQNIALRLLKSGALVEKRFPEIAPPNGPGGIELLHHTYAFAIGTWQLCDPAHQLTHASDAPELAMFKRDVFKDLRAGLAALWSGFTAPAPSPILHS
jgi:AcrR family transcriptional regulator